MTTDKLLPCPFCGGENIKLVDMAGWETWCKSCHACAGCTDNDGEPFSREQAIAAWNRRTPIRSLEAAPQPVGAPVAWMHVMDNTDGIKGNKPWVVFTASKKNPFGKPGIDYSKSYPVTSTPLYAAPPCALSNGGEGE